MSLDKRPTVYWFRRDLRLKDNPALHWAAKRGSPVICLFIYDDTTPEWCPGGASKWWLHYSLESLSESLAAAGNSLRIVKGDTTKALQSVIRESNACALAWNRRYEPDSIELDKKIKSHYIEQGLEVFSAHGNLCHEPWTVKRENQHPYRVFTAYWRASLRHESLPVTPAVKTIKSTSVQLKKEQTLTSLGLLPKLPWAEKFPALWSPGEHGADKNLKALLKQPIMSYKDARDIPSVSGTSRLSPHLAFGEITPRQINAAVNRGLKSNKLTADENVETFQKEIGWREFAYHLMYHFPHTVDQPLDIRFRKFPWKKIDPKRLDRWQQGNTGIPLIDAGMRQLWQTGWMHNRVRMVVGSLLIKNMGYHWREGAHWFWDTLVDADLASNTMGWQWVTGSGADAAPYFRVFNPVTQGVRFDPKGLYVRHWVPEIAGLPDKHIHSPWTASPTELQQAAIILGETYPNPIVDLKSTRVEALARFAKVKTPQ